MSRSLLTFPPKEILTPFENAYPDDITISLGTIVIAIDNPNTEGKGTVDGFDKIYDNDGTGTFFINRDAMITVI